MNTIDNEQVEISIIVCVSTCFTCLSKQKTTPMVGVMQAVLPVDQAIVQYGRRRNTQLTFLCPTRLLTQTINAG